ncbi:MAG TPA: glycosyltransferase [Gemmatimonadaceae bacterium]|nr:glycosyltransferase [Gemmatimonadaceae bacterium]
MLDLAQHLTAHCRVTVLAPAGPRTQPWERWGDVRVRRFPYFYPAQAQSLASGEGMVATMRASWRAKLQAPFFVASQWAMLPDLVRDEGIDLINPHWIVPQGFTAALWRRTLGVPMVVTAHGADVAWLERSVWGRAVARRVFSVADGLAPVSVDLAARIAQRLGRQIHTAVIPMGVTLTDRPSVDSPSAALGPRGTVPTILFVGKLVPKKGVDVLLEAVALLHRRERPVRLAIVGGGPLESALRARVHSLGIASHTEFVGWVHNARLSRYYAAADAVCLPSIRDASGETEGTPVVLLEALASGAIIVASRTGGIADVIRDGENGWLASPGDASALVDGLERALGLTASARERVRAAARATANDHRWERVAERYYTYFIRAVNQDLRERR